jgi:hypothetical protein
MKIVIGFSLLALFISSSFAGVFYKLSNQNGVSFLHKAKIEGGAVEKVLTITHSMPGGRYCNQYHGPLALRENSLFSSSDGSIVGVILELKAWYKYRSTDYMLISFDSGVTWTLSNLLETSSGQINSCNWIDSGGDDRKPQVDAKSIVINKKSVYVPVNANTVTTFVGCCDHRANIARPDNLVFKFTESKNSTAPCPGNIQVQAGVKCFLGGAKKTLIYSKPFQSTEQISWINSLRFLDYDDTDKLELFFRAYDLTTPRGEGRLKMEVISL